MGKGKFNYFDAFSMQAEYAKEDCERKQDCGQGLQPLAADGEQPFPR